MSGTVPHRDVVRTGLTVLAVLLVAAVLRLTGISKEPYWIDEVCSHDFSSGSVSATLDASARDVHPPLYYLGLKGWRAMLGSSAAVERGYSTAWSVLAVALLMVLATDVGRRRSAGIVAGLLLAVHPLDVYYAQEARMYAQAAALTLLSSWLLLRWLRVDRDGDATPVWPWALGYWAAASLVLYTHYVTATVLVAQGLFALAVLLRRRAWRSVSAFQLCAVGCAAVLMPWLVFVHGVRGGLYGPDTAGWSPGAAALRAVDLLDLFGRDLVWGACGMSPNVWRLAMAYSVLVFLALGVGLVVLVRGSRGHDSDAVRRDDVLFASWLVVGPVLVATVTSWLYLPVIKRPSFSLLVLGPLVLLVAVALDRFPNRAAGVAFLAVLVTTMMTATVTQYRSANKHGLAGFAALWNDVGAPDDVLFYPRWNRRVAGYHLGEPVLNVPTRASLERDLRRGTPRTVWVCRTRGYDMERQPASEHALHDWVLSLGPNRCLAEVDDVEVIEVLAQPLRASYPALTIGARVDFGDSATERYLWEGWYHSEKTFRWSKGHRATFVFTVDQPSASALTLEMFCFHRQRVTVELNERVVETFPCTERAPHVRRFDVPSGVAGRENTLVFHLPDAVAPKAVSESTDTRIIALGISWLQID